LVGQRILTTLGRLTGVEVYSEWLQSAVSYLGQRDAIPINRLVDTLEIEIFGLRGRLFEVDGV